MATPRAPAALPWQLSDIPFHSIDVKAIRDREDLLCIVAGSSFVEILSDRTTRNLIEYFEGDEEISDWLARSWEHEEVQHGRALREYVRHVWPEFDWDAAYRRFYEEYAPLCTVEGFEPTRCREMIARCVIEMGTSTYYRSLAEFAPESVLRSLAQRISDDEVRHYKHFLSSYRRYQQAEGVSRLEVLRVLLRRLDAARSEDADIALWHSYLTLHPDARRDSSAFRALFDSVTAVVRRHFPTGMAVKMLVRPLRLPPLLAELVSPPISALARLWILR